MTFSVELECMNEEAIDKIFQVVFDVLNDVREPGFLKEFIE